LILYLSLGGIIYYIYQQESKDLLKDFITDEEIKFTSINNVIEEWKKIYKNPIDPTQEIDFKTNFN
jgi:hypothetical protein